MDIKVIPEEFASWGIIGSGRGTMIGKGGEQDGDGEGEGDAEPNIGEGGNGDDDREDGEGDGGVEE